MFQFNVKGPFMSLEEKKKGTWMVWFDLWKSLFLSCMCIIVLGDLKELPKVRKSGQSFLMWGVQMLGGGDCASWQRGRSYPGECDSLPRFQGDFSAFPMTVFQVMALFCSAQERKQTNKSTKREICMSYILLQTAEFLHDYVAHLCVLQVFEELRALQPV